MTSLTELILVFLDIFAVFILAASTLIAFMRGFIREALTLVTISVALAATYYGAPHLQPVMNAWLGVTEGSNDKLFDVIPMTLVSLALSHGSIFIVLLVILSISSHFIAEFVKSIGLGAIDRSLGALFGLIRGIILLAILYLPFHFILDQNTKDGWFGSSKTHVYLEKTSQAMIKIVPDGWIEKRFVKAEKVAIEHKEEIQGAREKLQALDLLQKMSDEDREKLMGLQENVDMDKLQSDGYSDEFRQQLDSLIEENSEDMPVNE
ncbi:MAG TPA: hypothetical protein DIU06_06510 [Rhodospirillaceae bacterium]|nr:hypothetical protein [Rhodospirillaceae bacterium]